MSQKKYEELVAAGAPELPEGCFYRVTDRNNMIFQCVQVEIRKRVQLWGVNVGSRYVGRQELFLRKDETRTGLEIVVDMCNEIWDHCEKVGRGLTLPQQIRSLTGDHP